MAGAAAMLGPTAAPAGEYRGYETPIWRVLDRDGRFELRDYAPYLAAEVTLKGRPDAALRLGFQTLAGYIFGKNDGGRKLAMTSPVTRAGRAIDMTAPVSRTGADGIWTVRFMMPAGYGRDTLPAPDDTNIRIVTVAPALRAVVRFSGLATEARLAQETRTIMRWIAAKNLSADGPPEAAWYDDPFTLPWRRRNEVSVPVRRP